MIIGDRTIFDRVAIKARSSILCGRGDVTGSGTDSAADDVGHASRDLSSLALAVPSDSSASSSVFCESARCLA